MAKKKGTGLLIVSADIAADKEEEFNRWYNEEHISKLLAIPGFLDAARYEAVSGLAFAGGGAPKYLACYELESPEVICSEAYQRHVEIPTEWSKKMSPAVIGTKFTSNVYRQIFPSRCPKQWPTAIWPRPSRSAAWIFRQRSRTSLTNGTIPSMCQNSRR